jgi:hypothetical protein
MMKPQKKWQQKLIRRLKRAEPVTLVRSPTLTNKESLPIENDSSPANWQRTSILGIFRGG